MNVGNCRVCNKLTCKLCSGCGKGYYCDRDHQIYDYGDHKIHCDNIEGAFYRYTTLPDPETKKASKIKEAAQLVSTVSPELQGVERESAIDVAALAIAFSEVRHIITSLVDALNSMDPSTPMVINGGEDMYAYLTSITTLGALEGDGDDDESGMQYATDAAHASGKRERDSSGSSSKGGVKSPNIKGEDDEDDDDYMDQRLVGMVHKTPKPRAGFGIKKEKVESKLEDVATRPYRPSIERAREMQAVKLEHTEEKPGTKMEDIIKREGNEDEEEEENEENKKKAAIRSRSALKAVIQSGALVEGGAVDPKKAAALMNGDSMPEFAVAKDVFDTEAIIKGVEAELGSLMSPESGLLTALQNLSKVTRLSPESNKRLLQRWKVYDITYNALTYVRLLSECISVRTESPEEFRKFAGEVTAVIMAGKKMLKKITKWVMRLSDVRITRKEDGYEVRRDEDESVSAALTVRCLGSTQRAVMAAEELVKRRFRGKRSYWHNFMRYVRVRFDTSLLSITYKLYRVTKYISLFIGSVALVDEALVAGGFGTLLGKYNSMVTYSLGANDIPKDMIYLDKRLDPNGFAPSIDSFWAPKFQWLKESTGLVPKVKEEIVPEDVAAIIKKAMDKAHIITEASSSPLAKWLKAPEEIAGIINMAMDKAHIITEASANALVKWLKSLHTIPAYVIRGSVSTVALIDHIIPVDEILSLLSLSMTTYGSNLVWLVTGLVWVTSLAFVGTWLRSTSFYLLNKLVEYGFDVLKMRKVRGDISEAAGMISRLSGEMANSLRANSNRLEKKRR